VAAGASCVIASDVNPKRLALAKNMGAQFTVQPSEVEATVRAATQGLGVDVVLEMSGVPAAIHQAFKEVRVGGRVLAQQTNLALAECRHPWAFYLQADEVVHEQDHGRIRAALARWDGDESVDALRFRFLHFEGTYAYVNYVRYRKQCRVVRNNGQIQSVGDAAGFGRRDGRPLRIRRSGAKIYHYGWARAPEVLKRKTLAFQKLYHDDAWVAERYGEVPPEYLSDVDIAFRFRGTHPSAMAECIGGTTWEIPADRRPPLDSPLLNPRFYAAWLRKWHILPRR